MEHKDLLCGKIRIDMGIKKLIAEIEKISKIYSSKFKINRDADWLTLKLQEEMGELIQSYLMLSGRGRTKGKTNAQLKKDFANELADVFCHTLLLAKYHKIDIEKIIKDKWLIWNKK